MYLPISISAPYRWVRGARARGFSFAPIASPRNRRARIVRTLPLYWAPVARFRAIASLERSKLGHNPLELLGRDYWHVACKRIARALFARLEAVVEQLVQFLFGAVALGAFALAQYALVMFWLGY